MTEERYFNGVAVALAVDPDGPLIGVLLSGESGRGKSTLALALIDACPWRRTRLVADDVVAMTSVNGGLAASAPQAINGLIEVRGFGPARVRAARAARVRLGFDLDAPAARLPAAVPRLIAGQAIPFWPLAAPENAANRCRAIVRSFIAGQIP
ncbi:MAG: hypothetical protein AAGJ87_06690 [Pseudomonadota bacterium]